ncbi:MAG TPA: hypothetical protein VJR92_13410 [Gemmatimonadaceae bacterium]|nr:hypothetical protein [Gemmatimonadaceae bacterium]
MTRLLVPVAALAVAACAGSSSRTPPAATPAPQAAVAPPAAPPVATPPVTPPPPTSPATPWEPSGVYEMQLTFGGSPLPVTMELWKENGQWRGTVGNPNLGSADLSTFATEGRWFKGTFVVSGGPTFAFEVEVNMDNTVKGTWSGNGDGSGLTGKKTK